MGRVRLSPGGHGVPFPAQRTPVPENRMAFVVISAARTTRTTRTVRTGSASPGIRHIRRQMRRAATAPPSPHANSGICGAGAWS